MLHFIYWNYRLKALENLVLGKKRASVILCRFGNKLAQVQNCPSQKQW
jgi:hypothetical protein